MPHTQPREFPALGSKFRGPSSGPHSSVPLSMEKGVPTAGGYSLQPKPPSQPSWSLHTGNWAYNALHMRLVSASIACSSLFPSSIFLKLTTLPGVQPQVQGIAQGDFWRNLSWYWTCRLRGLQICTWGHPWYRMEQRIENKWMNYCLGACSQLSLCHYIPG